MSLFNRIALGFLELILGVCLLASGVLIITWPTRDSGAEAREYRAKIANYEDGMTRDEANISRLARAVNPLGSVPTCFVLSAGFLAVVYSRRRAPAQAAPTSPPPAPRPGVPRKPGP